MRVTQLNLNHCFAAQQLLYQAVTESLSDIAIISDPYRIPSGNGNWISDGSGMAAIWTTSRFPVQEIVSTSNEGYAVAKVNGVYYCSCYAPPRWSTEQFARMIDRATGELIGLSPLVVAGDFNAWATEWGSRRTNQRGRILLEALAKLNIDLANVGLKSTFSRNGAESIIDVTFCSPGLITNWRVDDGYTHSDHLAVCYSVDCKTRPHVASRINTPAPRGWRISHFNEEVFAEAIRLEHEASRIRNPSADQLVAILSRACDATMPRNRQPRHGRPPVYWWTDAIADLRRACLQARRRIQRARTDEEREDRREAFSSARAAYKRAI